LDFAEDDDDNAHSVGVGEAVKGTALPIADRGTGGHEGECIKAGVVNAYRLAELDVFQVGRLRGENNGECGMGSFGESPDRLERSPHHKCVSKTSKSVHDD
jgi:hypothetical protein